MAPTLCAAQTTVGCEVVDNSIILDVLIDNSQNARLLLDTGAQTTTFTASAAARLHLAATASADSRSLFSSTGYLNTLSIGPITSHSVSFGVLKLKNDLWSHIQSTRGTVDGSLGLDFLSQYAVGIRLDRSQAFATFWKSGNLNAEKSREWFNYLQIVVPLNPGITPKSMIDSLSAELPPGSATYMDGQDHLEIWLPPGTSISAGGRAYRNPVASTLSPTVMTLEPHDGQPYSIRGELDGTPFQFDLDTGSSQLTLPSGFINVLKPAVITQDVPLHVIDTTESARGCVYRKLDLSGFQIAYPFALASTGQSAYTGSITAGAGLFVGCKLLLDFPAHTLSVAALAPLSDAPKQALADLGIFQLEIGGTRRLYIGQGSPAERTGIRTGDLIVRLDGLPPAQTDEAISVRLADETTPVRVVVRHRGDANAVEYTFDAGIDRHWLPTPAVSRFPQLPPGYSGAKRFPNGGIYIDSSGITKLVKPGGSVLFENGRYLVTYRSTNTRSFTLNLPVDRFRIVPAQREPGTPPREDKAVGVLWIGGVGWVTGPIGTRVELDGFTVSLKAPQQGFRQAPR